MNDAEYAAQKHRLLKTDVPPPLGEGSLIESQNGVATLTTVEPEAAPPAVPGT